MTVTFSHCNELSLFYGPSKNYWELHCTVSSYIYGYTIYVRMTLLIASLHNITEHLNLQTQYAYFHSHFLKTYCQCLKLFPTKKNVMTTAVMHF